MSPGVAPPFRILPIAEEHVGGFHAALDGVARERRYLGFLEAPPLEATRGFVLDNIRTGQTQFVAIVGGLVVGWCDILRKSRPMTRHAGSLGMGVLATHRGVGIGTALLHTTLTAARETGLAWVELWVRTDNAIARRLYEKAGFEVEGVCRRHLLVDGAFYDAVQMAKLCDAPAGRSAAVPVASPPKAQP